MKVTKTIEVEMLYECGRCGNGQRLKHKSEDGLLQVPKVYCGNCTKGRGLVPMSETFVSVKSSELEDDEVRQFDVEREEVDDMKAQIKELQEKLEASNKNKEIVMEELRKQAMAVKEKYEPAPAPVEEPSKEPGQELKETEDA